MIKYVNKQILQQCFHEKKKIMKKLIQMIITAKLFLQIKNNKRNYLKIKQLQDVFY